MHKSKIISLVLLAALSLLMSCSNCKKEKQQYVVMLSLDGFRWDYPDSIATPNLDYIASHGVKAEWLKPSFPTKTFPNHYTMATGLYPDHHGIVNNSFYDPEKDVYYAIRMREAVENGEFYGGEPIWVTAEKQGLRSASYFWVGSEAAIQGIQPSITKTYDHDFPFEQRIDSVISWLNLPPESRPHLILWYMHEPDDISHSYGPQSIETREMVMYLDSLVGDFLIKVKKLPIADQVNIIVTSDHGMGAVDSTRLVILNQYVKDEWIQEYQGYNPNVNMMAAPGCYDSAYNALKSIEHIKVWKHGGVPERLHYGNNPRTLDFIVVADSAWSLQWDDRKFWSKGAHGYENDNSDIFAIFYGMGPAFKENHLQPAFNNTDIYLLIANLLGLEAAETDGTFENTKGMLKSN